MPRLLLISTVPAFIKAFLLPFPEHFRTLGWKVDAMASGISSDDQCVAAFDKVWDVNWSRNPFAATNLLQGCSAVRAAVTEGGHDLVHVHTPVAGLVSRLALRRKVTSVRIYTAHGFHFHEYGSPLKNLVFLALEKLGGRWTDHLVVINRDDEKAVLKHRLLGSRAPVYMPGIGLDTSAKYNAVTVDENHVARFRTEIGARPGDSIILMAAEFIPRKRHQDALAALPMIAKPNVHLVFAGVGPLVNPMKELARDLGIHQRVHFVGLRSDIPVLMRSADAVLLCSAQEGLPRSVMEALSLEVPVVASNIRGTRELLSNATGYLYPVGNVEALAEVLSRVLCNPQEAKRKTQVGRERIVSYDVSRILSMHERLYASALCATDVKSYSR